MPPSSRGLGRSPFKATTGVRIPVGALTRIHPELHLVVEEQFISMLRFEQRGKVAELSFDRKWYWSGWLHYQKKTIQALSTGRYIPITLAANTLGYSDQYLRRLLRNHKLKGIKIGQIWLVEIYCLKTYLDKANNSKDSRWGPKRKRSGGESQFEC